LNVRKFSVSLISGGRLFQMSGPAIECSATKLCSTVRFTTAVRFVDWNQQRCTQRCIGVASLNKTLQSALDRQPVQSLQRTREVYSSIKIQYQLCGRILYSLQWCHQSSHHIVINVTTKLSAVAEMISRRWRLSRYGWSWSVHCGR